MFNICRRFLSKVGKYIENENYLIENKRDKINKIIDNNDVIYLPDVYNKVIKSNIMCDFTKEEKKCGDCECNEICGLRISDTEIIYKNK